MVIIEKIHARQILDSRGNPTVEVEAHGGGFSTRAAVPSGASTGVNEALELRDKKDAFGGKGVLQAVSNVNTVLAMVVKGRDPLDQEGADRAMLDADGTPDKNKLGANAVLGVSMAVAYLGAQVKGIPLYSYLSSLSGVDTPRLPMPQMNVINGGKHAGQDNDIQEHMIAPVGAKSFSEALQMGAETYHVLRKMLKGKFGARGTLIGDEGGFVPPLEKAEDRLGIMAKAAAEAGYENEIVFALDAAASEFYKDGTYTIGSSTYSAGELVDYYKEISSTFPIYSIEDGHDEEDWEGFSLMTKALGGKVQIVGDDLLCTNPTRIARAVDEKTVNALLLKVNQIGSVTEALSAFKASDDAGWGTVVSHRSGETEDAFIADLVVGIGSGQSKFGAPARSDRNAKYNQLLRIEESLGDKAKYASRPI
ncbi:MAG: phosphopyruvate hydratase [archaeon]